MKEAGAEWGAVLNDEGILLGRVRSRSLSPDDNRPVTAVMEEGPATYRLNVPARELAENMRKGGFDKAFVTDADGRLLGIVTRSGVERPIEDLRAG